VLNAVDRDLLRTQPSMEARLTARGRLGIAPDAPGVGTVGRLMQGKDQASVLEAFASVRSAFPRARMVIAGVSADCAPDGVGDYGDYLHRQVNRLGLGQSVIFTGFVPHGDMPDLYCALDVFVHPCVEEPFGLVVVEAMASSLPVVAVRGGGIPEIIRDGIDGLLVSAHNPAAFAQAVVRLLADPPTAQHLARSGRRRVHDAFAPEVQGRSMFDVYAHLARAPRHCLAAAPLTGRP
jgi:phenylacetate-CoA ligase